MKAQTLETIANYDRKHGAQFLAQILPDVKHVEIVKPVKRVDVATVSVFWKIFWIVVWLLIFAPIAIIAFFVAGNRTETTWTDGQYNVTLKDGGKLVLTGNEDYLVAFANDAEKKTFLN